MDERERVIAAAKVVHHERNHRAAMEELDASVQALEALENRGAATGDDNGGIAVWPNSEYALHNAHFVRTRPSFVPSEMEHRVFSQRRASAMLTFMYDVQELVRSIEDRAVDDGRGVLQQRFLGAVMQANARYQEAIRAATQ